jgi:GNAT superfamily N-acetyltransferase
MHVTHHRGVYDRRQVERLWSLYEESFGPTSSSAPSKEMLFRSEFEEMLGNESNRLWVLHDDRRPIGMCMVATDVALARYLSRSYFQRHFPDHVQNGLVHLIAWLAVHPDYEGTGAIVRLAKEVLGVATSEGALMVFDAPQIHQPDETGGFAEMMTRLARMVGSTSSSRQIEVQRYFVIDFAESEAASVAEPAARPQLRAV